MQVKLWRGWRCGSLEMFLNNVKDFSHGFSLKTHDPPNDLCSVFLVLYFVGIPCGDDGDSSGLFIKTGSL